MQSNDDGWTDEECDEAVAWFRAFFPLGLNGLFACHEAGGMG